MRKVVFGTSHQGREISGVEISKNVDDNDGRPVFFVMAVHHAREWPAMESAMELAHLLVQGQNDSRIAGLLAKERVVILPLVNPDGFISSRNAFDPGDALLGQQPEVTLVEAIAPFGGQFAYRRKNCNGEIFPPSLPCELAWGIDPNRNYGFNWGGPGSSPDVTSQGYHGPSPRSESEVQAVWNFVRKHHVTTLLTLHNVAALVLRPPGTSGGGQAPDEAKLKAIGDAMGAAAGYTSQYGFELYDTSGTTEDDTYAATGGFGYTIEIGPPDGNFHMPYETGVVAEWTGANPHSNNKGGLKEALLIAAAAAAEPADHAIVKGTAPAGRVLRLRKSFQTRTSSWCSKGIEPVVNIVALQDAGLGAICLTGQQPPLTLNDALDATTTVPASGAFEWHVGPSTRPFVLKAGQKEAYTLTCEQPDGTVLDTFTVTIDRGQTLELNPGCGAGGSRFADGTPVGAGSSSAPGSVATPSVNGFTAPPPTAAKAPAAKAPAKKPVQTRAQKLASCKKTANKIKNAAARRRQALVHEALRAEAGRRAVTRRTRGLEVGGEPWTVRVRKDIWDLGDEDDPWRDPAILAYARAVAAMKKVDTTDPRNGASWRNQAAIHARRAEPVRGRLENQCQHASWYFLPWHRMYLYRFEQILRSHMPAATAATWALPYWNYTQVAAHRPLPPAFRQRKLPDGKSNPLYLSKRQTSPLNINGGDPLPSYAVTPQAALAERVYTSETPARRRASAAPRPASATQARASPARWSRRRTATSTCSSAAATGSWRRSAPPPWTRSSGCTTATSTGYGSAGCARPPQATHRARTRPTPPSSTASSSSSTATATA